MTPDSRAHFTDDKIIKSLNSLTIGNLLGQMNYKISVRFSVMHGDLIRAINDMIKDKKYPYMVNIWNYLPTFKRQGYKSPNKLHPTTCLPTTYNIVTAALTSRVSNHQKQLSPRGAERLLHNV